MTTLELIEFISDKTPEIKSFVLKVNWECYSRIQLEVASNYGSHLIHQGEDDNLTNGFFNWMKFEINGRNYKVYQDVLGESKKDACYITEFKRYDVL